MCACAIWLCVIYSLLDFKEQNEDAQTENAHNSINTLAYAHDFPLAKDVSFLLAHALIMYFPSIGNGQ